jgi:hypothetical protein
MTDTDPDYARRQAALKEIRELAFPLPEGYKFNRDELYDERFDSSVLGRWLKESGPESVSPDGDTLNLDRQ